LAMNNDEMIEKALKVSKLRRTPVRAGLLEVLAKSARPMGAVEILEKLPPHTDAVTVYRTLNTYNTKGVVHRVRGGDRVWRYALGDATEHAKHQHPHFVCESCGRLECIKDAEIPESFLKSLGLPKGYVVSYPEVVLHGLCPKCAKLGVVTLEK